MIRHVLAVIGYVVVTFAVQGTSHLAINAAHYAAVPHIKPEPIFPLGFLSMIVQGTVLSLVYAGSRFAGGKLLDAMKLAWLFGAFLVSYIAFAEAAKYAVPSVAGWIAVELVAGAVQFTLAGLALGLAHRVGR